MAIEFVWRRTVALLPAMLLCILTPLAAQTSRLDLLDQKSLDLEAKEMLQNKAPTRQNQRVPLDGLIDRNEYMLGPGDEVDISIWGGQEFKTYDLYVSAEGRLLLPSVGPIEVGGLSVSQAEAELAVRTRVFFTDARVALSLINPRLFRAFVVGGVFNPGTYYMSAVDRVSDLVKEGGGLKATASRRRLNLMDRERKPVAVADLLTYNATGSPAFNPRLSDGCILEVPPLSDYVIMRGHFVNLSGVDSIRVTDYLKEEAAEYRVEFLPGESLADLLKLTGLPVNFADSADDRIDVIDPRGGRREIALHGPEIGQPVATGTIFEFPVPSQWVYVSGNVTRGGRFLYQPGLKVRDYLGQAGGPNWTGANDICLVTRADGTRSKVPANGTVGPGDMLYVPGRVQWLDRTIGPIIGLVGVMIAVFHK